MRLRQAKKIMYWCKEDGDYYTIHRSKDHRDSFWRKMQKLRPAYIKREWCICATFNARHRHNQTCAHKALSMDKKG